jgi:hypothetical protein
MKDVESWERPHMSRLVKVFLLGGIVGYLAMLGVGLLFRDSYGFAFAGFAWLSWLVAGILLLPRAFHKGVEVQRQRQAE